MTETNSIQGRLCYDGSLPYVLTKVHNKLTPLPFEENDAVTVVDEKNSIHLETVFSMIDNKPGFCDAAGKDVSAEVATVSKAPSCVVLVSHDKTQKLSQLYAQADADIHERVAKRMQGIAVPCC